MFVQVLVLAQLKEFLAVLVLAQLKEFLALEQSLLVLAELAF